MTTLKCNYERSRIDYYYKQSKYTAILLSLNIESSLEHVCLAEAERKTDDGEVEELEDIRSRTLMLCYINIVSLNTFFTYQMSKELLAPEDSY